MFCCIHGCSNTTKEGKHKSSGVKFYHFPTNSTHMPWLCEKRLKWINAVRKHTKHPNHWFPRKNTTICSAHFIGNKKSENPLSQAYMPVIFPGQKPGKKSRNFEKSQNEMQQAKSEETDTAEDSLVVSTEDTNTPKDPPNLQQKQDINEALAQCRLCLEFSKDCVDVTNTERPYLTRNKTTITLNDLNVELDFNKALPKTVCQFCDSKLREMINFFKKVKEAQESLIDVRDCVKKEIETLIVKVECEPTPDNVGNIDSKEGTADPVTVTKAEFVKPISKNKRKLVELAPIIVKKLKATKAEESLKLIKVIKEEKSDPDDDHSCKAEKLHFSEMETDKKLIKFELASNSLVNEKTDNRIFT